MLKCPGAINPPTLASWRLDKSYGGVQGGRGSGVVFSSWPGCCNFVFRREIFWGKVQNIYYIPGSGPEIFSKYLI